MALIECPECKHAISDHAIACPSCGLPLTPLISQPVESVEPVPSKDDNLPTVAETPSPQESIPPVLPSEQQSFRFAIFYAYLCFFGCLVAVFFGIAAGLQIIQSGDLINDPTTQRSASQLIGMIILIALWSSTGVAILRRKKSAITLSYVGAVVAVIGILARGLIPIDIILAIPTFLIIGYLRRRSSLLS